VRAQSDHRNGTRERVRLELGGGDPSILYRESHVHQDEVGFRNIHTGEAQALVNHPERESGEDVLLTLRSGDARG
jgi:hypothetical protein